MVASLLGIDRKNIYHKKKGEKSDQELKEQIIDVWKIHPSYGHRRLAIHLSINRKRILRVMHKYSLKPPRRSYVRHYTTRSVYNHSYTNLIKNLPIKTFNQVWVCDLTYIKYDSKFIYLATIEDIFNREIKACDISNHHDSSLVCNTISQAIKIHKTTPQIFHTDQGSEFLNQNTLNLLKSNNISISVSDKASPWQNGYKESFFSHFKQEFGDFNRFDSLPELVEEIYSYIKYYNSLRIHSSLKMSPLQFKSHFPLLS